MAAKLRVGFVGLGRVFDLNVRGYLGHPEAEVAALCDSDTDLLARRAAEHPNAVATRNFEEFLRADLDIVEILTPHPLHEAMAVAALERGAHISVQKPMAMTLQECDRMIAAADRSGRRLKVFENFLFYPPLVRARQLLRDGAIGKPLHFRMKVVMADRAQAWTVPENASRWRHALAAAGRGGPMVFDHGHHMMAVALWLFGDLREGYACIESTETPAGVYDAPATLTWRHADPPVHGVWDVSLALKMTLRTDYYADAERFEIQGEEGILQVTRCSDRMLDEPVLTLYRDGEVRAFHNLETDWAASFPRSTRHFLDVIAGREAQQVLTGREGRRVIAMYDLFQRSNAERRALTA
ncbi:MAG TPA: Gfo/Idh/MocA family oxidoreductase [Roseiarcus sp.]|nr:Gfo/Idh/MocA family oxidoreductase [Roseiarcus sp.]